MVESLAKSKMSVSDYLSWESQQTNKNDFFSGKVFAMTGGTLRHNLATVASVLAFKSHLAGSPCKVFSGDVKVAVLDTEAPRLEVFRRNVAERFELFVFEGADCEAELASIGWRGPVASLLD